MWGWRARIGHIHPYVLVENVLSTYMRVLPEGVTLVLAQLTLSDHGEATLERTFGEIDAKVQELAARAVDMVVVGGAPVVHLKGLGSDQQLIARLEAETGIPVTTTQTAAIEALRSLQARRIGLITPFGGRPVDDRARWFLEQSGFDVFMGPGLNIQIGQHPRENPDISMAVAYQHARRTFWESGGVDAVYSYVAPFMIPNLPQLEAEIGVPVVTSVHAAIWACFKRLNIREPLGHHGWLLGTLA